MLRAREKTESDHGTVLDVEFRGNLDGVISALLSV